jgi:putative sterol carrier protein
MPKLHFWLSVHGSSSKAFLYRAVSEEWMEACVLYVCKQNIQEAFRGRREEDLGENFSLKRKLLYNYWLHGAARAALDFISSTGYR